MIIRANSISELKLPAAAVTIGAFDGIHKGHQSLVKSMIADAKSRQVPTVMITFDPLPFVFFTKTTDAMNIVTPDERAEIAEKLGISYLVTLRFDQSLADQSAEEFIHELSDHLGMESLWIGADFSLGRNREGTQQVLKDLSDIYHYQVHIVPEIELDGLKISSTRIRKYLQDGDVKKAWQLLGYPYFLETEIVHGAALGRKLGIPTMNMKFPAGKVIPKNGVYVADIWFDEKRYDAVTSVGTRPTFYSNGEVVVETFMLSANAEKYGATAKVEFLEFLRPEYRYDFPTELVAQIQLDILRSEEYFLNRKKSDS